MSHQEPDHRRDDPDGHDGPDGPIDRRDGSREFRQYRFTAPPGAADIILIRHGESAPARLDDPFPLVDGRSDPPLDPRGREEAQLVAERLEKEEVSAIYITPLRRTAETAAPLADRLGIEPRVEPGLVEVHLGKWEGGVFRKHVADGHPLARQMYAEERWDMIPGAESTEAFEARIRDAVDRIAAAHRDERVVVVTHGGVIAAILAMATGARRFAFLGVDNASLSHVVVLDDEADGARAEWARRSRWLVRRVNDTGHLGTDLDRPPQPLGGGGRTARR